jgi:putative tryptophan/tyrosine transport system substrate-binding protein
MQRRGFIGLLGMAMAGLPFTVRAQQAKPVIAFLASGAADAASSKLQMSLLDAGMRELGLVQGQDYLLDVRWAGSDAGRFSPLAAELLAGHPRAVVVSTNLAATVVQQLSPTVSIVGTGLNAPVATGLVASLAHPGGTITGVATMADDVLLKLFEFMREMLPDVRRVAVMKNPTNPSNPLMLDLLTAYAAKEGFVVDAVSVSAPSDLDSAFAELSRVPPGALLVLTDNSLFALADRIIAQALAHRVPTFGNFSSPFARAGALVAYSRDPREAFQGVARLLKKLLDGAAPGDLPFEQPTKFNLFINLKTARTLGLNVPPTLLATADEVIE